MPKITILGQVIDFPNSGASPLWSPALIAFAQAVEAALLLSIGTFDIPPQTLIIDAFNPGVNVRIDALIFPPSQVQSTTITYSCIRRTSDTGATPVLEQGTIGVLYNPLGAPGDKWSLYQNRSERTAGIEFTIDDNGQVYFTTSTLPGTNHVGTLSFFAKSLTET